MSFYKNFPGGAAVAYLTFSQPVDNTTVSIDGLTLLPTSSDTTLMMTTDLSITMNQNLFDLKVNTNQMLIIQSGPSGIYSENGRTYWICFLRDGIVKIHIKRTSIFGVKTIWTDLFD